MSPEKAAEELSLPTPVSHLWAGTWPFIERLRKTLEPEQERWAMGGGSVLAARWRHRQSTDLDLTTTAMWPTQKLGTEGRNRLTDTMEPLGGSLGLWNKDFVEIEFDQGRLQILRQAPAPTAGHQPGIVNGQAIEVLIAASSL